MNRTMCEKVKWSRSSQAGFTLVELAIVLLIIGLILSGVLKGQDLVNAARLNSVLTDANQIRTAAGTFQTKYTYLPGDIPTTVATTAFGWTGTLLCNATGNHGDGRIEGVMAGAVPVSSEAMCFWGHMRAATLISAPAPTNGSYATDISFTDSWSSRVGGLYTVEYSDGTGTAATLGVGIGAGAAVVPLTNDGNFIVLSNMTVASTPRANLLTPAQAYEIDLKSDDGLPYTGTLMATGVTAAGVANSGACTSTATASAVYNTSDRTACSIYIRM